MTHPKPTWLHPEERRTLKAINEWVEPQTILHRLKNAEFWEYKETPSYYHARDRALVSLLYLTGLRVSEVLGITKKQFDFKDPQFILIKDVVIRKRKAKTIQAEGVPKIDVALPLIGELAEFTDFVFQYYQICETLRLFPFGTKRAWAITNKMTGLWNHYFRSQRISDMMNRQGITSSLKVARILGLKNPMTISHYYKGTWKEAREELLK